MTDVNTIVDNLLERIQNLEEENEEMNIIIHAANERLKEYRKLKKMSIWKFIKWRKK